MRPTLLRTAALADQCFDDDTALELVEDVLPPARKATVLAHAESCEACRRLLADLASVAEPVDAPPAHVPVHVGLWQLLEPAGRGASATVYRARNLQSGQIAAVKLVSDPALRVRFEREARTLATLRHPGIVRYIEHGELADGTMFLVMQWLEGHDLSQRLPAGGNIDEAERFSASEVLALAQRLANALCHAHARGCVHRDLSPKNVFLPGGQLAEAMILDFGLVRWVRHDAAQTASQSIVGTPYYMAPEQIRGVYDIDARADLFALGVLLYQAAAGRLPFDGEDLFSVWQRIVHAPHPDLGRNAPHMPRAFVELVEHLLEKAPSDRPATTEQVVRVLDGIRVTDLAPRPRRYWLGLGTAAVLGGATLAGIGLWNRPDNMQITPNILVRRPTPVPAAPVPAPATAGTGPVLRHLRGNKLERGQLYRSLSTDEEDAVPAITVLGGTLTLEDCRLEGLRSVLLMGDARLVLRRCQLEGEVTLMGRSTLVLDATELATKPRTVGFTGRIEKR